MKKIIALILAAAAMLSLAACKDNPDSGADTTAQQTAEVQTDSAPVSDAEIKKLASDIIKKADLDINLAKPVAVDFSVDGLAESYFGIDPEGKVDCAVAVEPTIGTTPFSLCLVQLSDGVNHQQLAKEIFDGTDSQRWVFFSAKKILVSYSGNIVLVAMGDTADVDKAFSAFSSLTENKASAPLEKAGTPVEASTETDN